MKRAATSILLGAAIVLTAPGQDSNKLTPDLAEAFRRTTGETAGSCLVRKGGSISDGKKDLGYMSGAFVWGVPKRSSERVGRMASARFWKEVRDDKPDSPWNHDGSPVCKSAAVDPPNGRTTEIFRRIYGQPFRVGASLSDADLVKLVDFMANAIASAKTTRTISDTTNWGRLFAVEELTERPWLNAFQEAEAGDFVFEFSCEGGVLLEAVRKTPDGYKWVAESDCLF